jgi:YjbE family integral membrane protein
MFEHIFEMATLVALVKIVLLDILLGGDNALVIAMATKNLPDNLRKKGVLYGTIGAIAIRVVLVFFAVQLLTLPALKLIGGVLLMWVGVKLLSTGEDEHNMNASDKLWNAVKTILVADLIMSFDNVIAMAGATQGANEAHQLPLILFGLLLSVPIIMYGSGLIGKLIDKFPFIVLLGSMLLGWIGGSMMIHDVLLVEYVKGLPTYSTYISGAIGAGLVGLIGKLIYNKKG